MECQVEGKDMIFETDNSPIAGEKEGTGGETVRMVEEDGGEDMEGREEEVVGEADRSLQEKAGATHRMAIRPPVGGSKDEGDPGMILERGIWERGGAIRADGRDTSKGSARRLSVTIVGRRATSRDNVLGLVRVGPKHQGEWGDMHKHS